MNPQALFFQALYQAPFIQGPTELSTFSASGGSQNLTITCNINWSIQSKPAWITVNKSSGTGNATITVTAASNPGFERDGYIVISGEGVSLNVYVYQNAGS